MKHINLIKRVLILSLLCLSLVHKEAQAEPPHTLVAQLEEVTTRVEKLERGLVLLKDKLNNPENPQQRESLSEELRRLREEKREAVTAQNEVRGQIELFKLLPVGEFTSEAPSDAPVFSEFDPLEKTIETLVGSSTYQTQIGKVSLPQTADEPIEFSFTTTRIGTRQESKAEDIGLGKCITSDAPKMSRCLLVNHDPSDDAKVVIREYTKDEDGRLHSRGAVVRFIETRRPEKRALAALVSTGNSLFDGDAVQLAKPQIVSEWNHTMVTPPHLSRPLGTPQRPRLANSTR